MHFQKREIPWEKVPFVPRPSLVPDPVTAFSKRPSAASTVPNRAEKLVITPLTPLRRAAIRPQAVLPPELPPRPYVSPRDATRERVMDVMRKKDLVPKELPASDAMDVVLPKLYKTIQKTPPPTYKRRIIYSKVYP